MSMPSVSPTSSEQKVHTQAVNRVFRTEQILGRNELTSGIMHIRVFPILY